jgi:hypothetical protein
MKTAATTTTTINTTDFIDDAAWKASEGVIVRAPVYRTGVTSREESILPDGQPSGLPILEDLSSISAPDLEVPTLSTSLDAVLVRRDIGYGKCERVIGVASDVSDGSPRKRQDTVTVAQTVFVIGGKGNLASLRHAVRRPTILWRSLRSGVTLLRSRRSSGLSTACGFLCCRRPGHGRFCHGPRAKKRVGDRNQREQTDQ